MTNRRTKEWEAGIRADYLAEFPDATEDDIAQTIYQEWEQLVEFHVTSNPDHRDEDELPL